jgi:hypothetical protein
MRMPLRMPFEQVPNLSNGTGVVPRAAGSVVGKPVNPRI